MKHTTFPRKAVSLFATFALLMNLNAPVTMALAAEGQPDVPSAEATQPVDVTRDVAADESSDTLPEDETDAAEYPAATLTATAGGVTVTVEAPAGALPEGAYVKATIVDDAKVEAAVEDASDDAIEDMLAIDVTIYDADGNEIQPLVPVSVKFANTKLDDGAISVYHVDDDYDVTEVETEVATPDTQEFEADGFSIYVVAAKDTEPRLNVVFKSGDETIATIAVKKGDNLNSVLYDPGVGELKEGVIFEGWTTKEDYDTTTTGLTIAKVREATADTLSGTITDGTTVTYHAILLRQYKVTYLDETGASLGVDTVKFRSDSTVKEQSYTISKDYTPKNPDTHAFLGWLVSDGKANIVDYEEGNTYAFGAGITIKGDVTFSVNEAEGHWLVFNENGKGATYNAPQFVKSGEKTSGDSLLEMKRYGYTFGGWYTDADCTDGNEFTFGGTISDTTTIYAKWVTQKTANYTVLIWKQKTTGEGYDFAESIKLSGTVGATVTTVKQQGTGEGAYARINGTDKKYTGFHLSEFDEDVTIATEGTSVVNVYYDRNEITLTFYTWTETGGTTYTKFTGRWAEYGRQYYGVVDGKYVEIFQDYYFGNWYVSDTYARYTGDKYYISSSSGKSWVEYEVMKGLYGSTLADNNYKWPTEYAWYANGDNRGGTSGTHTTMLDSFILSDGKSSTNFYGAKTTNGATIYFYKLDPISGTYKLANTVETGRNGSFNISDKYNGYHAVSYSTNGSKWNNVGSKNASTGYYGSAVSYNDELHIRFASNNYNILFNDGVYVDGNGKPVEGYSSRGELKV